MSNGDVYLLNADYTFLDKITWKKAAFLMAKNLVNPVKDKQGRVIKICRTVTQRYVIPAVLILKKFIRKKLGSRVPWSKHTLFMRDNFSCQYCGIQLDRKRCQVEHIIPVSKGGKTAYTNCITACRGCNQKKGNKTLREAKMFLRSKPYQPTIGEYLHFLEKSSGVLETLKECGVL